MGEEFRNIIPHKQAPANQAVAGATSLYAQSTLEGQTRSNLNESGACGGCDLAVKT